MPNSDLLPSLLFKINQNQLALEAAIMELIALGRAARLSEVGGNVRAALATSYHCLAMGKRWQEFRMI